MQKEQLKTLNQEHQVIEFIFNYKSEKDEIENEHIDIDGILKYRKERNKGTSGLIPPPPSLCDLSTISNTKNEPVLSSNIEEDVELTSNVERELDFNLTITDSKKKY